VQAGALGVVVVAVVAVVAVVDASSVTVLVGVSCLGMM